MSGKHNTLRQKRRAAGRAFAESSRPYRASCPRCHARPGEQCHDRGVQRQQPHKERTGR